MDPKFRLSIPVDWRPANGKLLLLFSKVYEMPALKVLSEAAYSERIALIESSDKTPAEKARLIGKLAMLCHKAALNDQGKLLVPKDVSTKLQIEADTEVMLVGRGKHFEIWSKENFQTMLDIETGAEDNDDLGIF